MADDLNLLTAAVLKLTLKTCVVCSQPYCGRGQNAAGQRFCCEPRDLFMLVQFLKHPPGSVKQTGEVSS